MRRFAELDPLSRDDEILYALVKQVKRAAAGGCETSVRTIITRPMWRAFLRAMGENEHQDPTAENPPGKCLRVFGSETILIESPFLQAWSFRRPE